ncbi:hypothetical protein AMATHDRAFT_74371 [Amanita thiersii Skay4041]|uniref:Terpenoid synthase n=1 Tax=Amanita thiersii Skay4041 TaxID=703135 RepID=A0A2A9NX46_9AGAR|nr:hypothetical protein AMATHDRAFT_74371 [Amanita thiersii Skay4041]
MTDAVIIDLIERDEEVVDSMMTTAIVEELLAALKQPQAGPTSAPPAPAPPAPLPPPVLTTQHRLHHPFSLVASELAIIRKQLVGLLGSAHPNLTDTAEYYFLRPSVQVRSLLILLFSRATNGITVDWQKKLWDACHERASGQRAAVDRALYDPDVLNDWHPTMPDITASFGSVFELRTPISYNQRPPYPHFPSMPTSFPASPTLLPSQLQLAQVMEMIHVASLLHDAVYDESPHRMNNETKVGENKLMILGGDFLLGRASAVLPQLGENEVVELVASVISNVVEGEMLRMEEVKTPEMGTLQGPKSVSEAWERYLRRTYLKTASLMAKGARASVVLGGCGTSDILKEAAYTYGRNLGFAKQLMDDASDYEFGLSDVRAGLATAPVLYAAEEYPELLAIIQRNLLLDGDLECAVDYVRRSNGVERTRELARRYGESARETLKLLREDEGREGLERLTGFVVGS